MKQFSLKLLLVSLLVFPALLTFAQLGQDGSTMPVQQKKILADQQVTQQKSVTSIFTEDFSGGTVPAAGWTIIGGAEANWNWYNTNNAGGTAPEAAFAWGPPYFSGNSKMVTPVISTSGASTLVLEFHYYVWDFAGSGYSYKIETTSDGGTTWNEVWSISPTGDIPAEIVTLVIDNEDVGSDNFQFACVFDGESSNINYWYFDDFDLTAETVETYNVTYIVKDEENNPVEGAQVNMQSGGTLTTNASGEVIFENILPGDYTWWATGTGLSTEEGSVTVTDADVTVDVVLSISYELLSEYFAAGTFPPEGWSVFGDGQSNWSQSFSANAAGEYPEASFNDSPNFSGNSKLVTPEIVTTSYTALFLEFKQFIADNTGSGYTLKVETTSDGGTTWNEVWSVSPTGEIGPEDVELLIDNDDVGSDIFQLAFTFDGNSSGIDNWYIDDVVLTAALGFDVGVVSIDIPSLAITGTVIDPAATIENLGSDVVSFDVSFEIIDGAAVYAEVLTVTDLAPLETEIVTFPAWTSIAGNFVVEVSVDLVNDQNPANDMLSQTLGVASGLVPKKALYEVFTSSTCPPCPAANEVIDGVLNQNPDAYTLIKYQMNWPGLGDPYYNADGGVRRDYYGVVSVPDLYINSDHLSPPTSFTQAIFDEYALEETALEIDIEASMDEENIITVSADLTSIIYYEAGLTAHIAVVEKLTTGNVGSNGETEFHNVMMKMLPDALGTTLGELTSGVPVTITESFDMDETNMETTDDIIVVVFVQNDTDKSLVQSEVTDVNGTLPVYGNLEGIVTDEETTNPIEGATVTAGSNTTTTDTDGTYFFMDITIGTYTVTCTAAGYVGETETVIVEDGQTATLDFALLEFVPPPVGCDDFDDLTVGGLVAEQLGGMWTTWSGTTADDATVSDAQSNSGSNSFVVDAGTVDLVRKFDDVALDAGQWLYSNYIYVPTGYSGYFNVQSDPAPGVAWIVDLFFDDGGTGSFGTSSTDIFTYAQDTWIFVEINMDLDSDLAWVKFDGVVMTEFAWDGTIGGIDYYGYDVGGNPGAYFDDVCFGEGEEIIIVILAPPTNLAGPDIVSYGEEIGLSWDAPVVANKASKELTGYNVYRKHNVGNFSFLDYTTETTYTDTAEEFGIFTYQVTAVYDPEGESDPSNEHVVDIVGSISEHLNNATQLYPNPATDVVNISSDYTMESVTVYNFAGQVVLTEIVNSTKYRVNTSNFEAGIYLFQIETQEGRIAKRIIIK